MAIEPRSPTHIRLTSHPIEGAYGALPIHWGAPDPRVRGPIRRQHGEPQPAQRHRLAQRKLRRLSRPRRRGGHADAQPPTRSHEHDADRSDRSVSAMGRSEKDRVDRSVRCDRRGSVRGGDRTGYDIRPTIAVTKAHIDLPEGARGRWRRGA
jgi:hypothetical protein